MRLEEPETKVQTLYANRQSYFSNTLVLEIEVGFYTTRQEMFTKFTAEVVSKKDAE